MDEVCDHERDTRLLPRRDLVVRLLVRYRVLRTMWPCCRRLCQEQNRIPQVLESPKSKYHDPQLRDFLRRAHRARQVLSTLAKLGMLIMTSEYVSLWHRKGTRRAGGLLVYISDNCGPAARIDHCIISEYFLNITYVPLKRLPRSGGMGAIPSGGAVFQTPQFPLDPYIPQTPWNTATTPNL